mgnify:CR=1 FL=1
MVLNQFVLDSKNAINLLLKVVNLQINFNNQKVTDENK